MIVLYYTSPTESIQYSWTKLDYMCFCVHLEGHRVSVRENFLPRPPPPFPPEPCVQ